MTNLKSAKNTDNLTNDTIYAKRKDMFQRITDTKFYRYSIHSVTETVPIVDCKNNRSLRDVTPRLKL